MNCPKCNTDNIGKSGYYLVKRDNKYHRRYKCKDCNKFFSERNSDFKKRKITSEIINEVKELFEKKLGVYKKYDPNKKLGYSTREIAVKVNISKSAVWEITKDLY